MGRARTSTGLRLIGEIFQRVENLDGWNAVFDRPYDYGLVVPKIRNQRSLNQRLKWLPRKGADKQNPCFKRRSFSDAFSLSHDDDLVVETA